MSTVPVVSDTTPSGFCAYCLGELPPRIKNQPRTYCSKKCANKGLRLYGPRPLSLTYAACHERVTRKRGKAADYPGGCQFGCGRPAREWMSNPSAPDLVHGPNRHGEMCFYSPSPEYYVASCVPCHRAHDKWFAEGERAWQKSKTVPVFQITEDFDSSR